MAPLAPPAPFPDVDLARLDGQRRPIAEAWARGPALIAVGHSECGTTRFALPFVDRVHRRAAPASMVVAVLQDTPAEASALVEELGLALPVRLDPDPYDLGARLGLGTAPTLFVVGSQGRIEAVSEGFRRADLEEFASRLGAPGPLFAPADNVPPLRPG
jgi:hypothetical protein